MVGTWKQKGASHQGVWLKPLQGQAGLKQLAFAVKATNRTFQYGRCEDGSEAGLKPGGCGLVGPRSFTQAFSRNFNTS